LVANNKKKESLPVAVPTKYIIVFMIGYIKGEKLLCSGLRLAKTKQEIILKTESFNGILKHFVFACREGKHTIGIGKIYPDAIQSMKKIKKAP
jgi:hypothetical protein